VPCLDGAASGRLPKRQVATCRGEGRQCGPRFFASGPSLGPRSCARFAHPQRNVPNFLTRKIVHLEKRKPRHVCGASRTAAALVTYFQGGARATVRTLCQTSVASRCVRVKRDFLLALRNVADTAHKFLIRILSTANFAFPLHVKPSPVHFNNAARPWTMLVRAPSRLRLWRPRVRAGRGPRARVGLRPDPSRDCNGRAFLGEGPPGHGGGLAAGGQD
jgi:hypothetical protein